MHRHNHQSQKGFTLIELLVASAIFVVIGAISYGGWYNIQTLKSSAEAQARRLDELQRAWYWIAEDFEQLIDRPVRDQLDTKYPALESNNLGDSLVEFTRSGWTNPAGDILPGRSTLQRVAYNLEEQTLYRRYWYHLDRYDTDEKKRRLLVSNVDRFSMRFLDNNYKWHDTWPPQSGSGVAPKPPKAVELTLELIDMGEIVRRFPVP